MAYVQWTIKLKLFSFCIALETAHLGGHLRMDTLQGSRQVHGTKFRLVILLLTGCQVLL